jgi:Animal haem peroxidase
MHCDRKPTRSVETSGRAFRARQLRSTFLPNRHLHATCPMCATCRGTRVTAFTDEGLTTAHGRRTQHDALHIPRFSHAGQGATMLHKRTGASRRGVANSFPRASRHFSRRILPVHVGTRFDRQFERQGAQDMKNSRVHMRNVGPRLRRPGAVLTSIALLLGVTAMAGGSASGTNRPPIPGRSRPTFPSGSRPPISGGSFPFEARSLDGGGNNQRHPTWGQANLPYSRVAGAAYADGRVPSSPARTTGTSATVCSTTSIRTSSMIAM